MPRSEVRAAVPVANGHDHYWSVWVTSWVECWSRALHLAGGRKDAAAARKLLREIIRDSARKNGLTWATVSETSNTRPVGMAQLQDAMRGLK